MKKFITLLAMGCLALGIAGCRDANVEYVKFSVFKQDKQKRVVERLLSSRLDNLKWRSFKSEDKKVIVEAKGIWRDKFFQQEFEKIKKSGRGQADMVIYNIFPMPGDQVVIQFALSADGKEFDFKYGKVCDAKGKIKEVSFRGKTITADSESGYKRGITFMNLFTQELK